MTHVFAPHWFKNCVNSRTLTDSQTWGQFPAGPSREPLPSRAQVPVLALAIVEAGEELHAQSGKGLRRQENMNTCIASRWQQKVSKTGSRILEPGSLDPWSWIYDFDARLGILQCVSGIMVAAGLTAVEFWKPELVSCWMMWSVAITKSWQSISIMWQLSKKLVLAAAELARQPSSSAWQLPKLLGLGYPQPHW